MNLRLKLLLLFAVCALGGLTFFGFIAYDTAREANIQKEVSTLRAFSNRLEDEIRQEGEQHTLSHGMPRSYRRNDLIPFILEQTGAISGIAESTLPGRLLAEIRKTLSDASDGHAVAVGDTHYSWYATPMVNDRHLVVVHSSPTSQASSFFKAMGVPLIFTSFIVFWLAAWSAMYVAKLIEQLDAQRRALEHQALHDTLTDLPNRTLLHDRLQQAMLTAQREKKEAALCFIDLNGFKEVNDMMGHHCGDELLKVVAQRLQGAIRKSDTVARLGGDEFAVILRNVSAKDSIRVAEKMIKAMEAPVEVEDRSFSVSGSFGIAVYPGHGKDAETLLRKADTAMYAAKRSGTRIVFYDEEKAHESNRSAALSEVDRLAFTNTPNA